VAASSVGNRDSADDFDLDFDFDVSDKSDTGLEKELAELTKRADRTENVVSFNPTDNSIADFASSDAGDYENSGFLSDVDEIVSMVKDDLGYFRSTVKNVSPGTKYLFHFDATTEHPDPASFYQPEDVMGPSSIVDHSAFKWQDKDWQGLSIEEMITHSYFTISCPLK